MDRSVVSKPMVAPVPHRLHAVVSRVGGRAWKVALSMRTALVLTLALAGMAVIGTLVAQAPPDVASDATAFAAWVDSMRPRFGAWTSVLERLQWFTIFDSIWFRGGVFLLTASLVVCSIARTRRLWQVALHPSTNPPGDTHLRLEIRSIVATSRSPGTVDAIVEAFSHRRFRVTVASTTASTDLVAVRFRWAPLGSVAAHLSVVLIVLGAVVGATWGFRDDRVSVPIGESVAVGHGTALTLVAQGFTDRYYPDGSPRDYASHVVLTRAGVAVADQDVRVNEPLRFGDVSVYQSYFGAAASVRIADRDGSVLFTGAVPLEFVTNDGRHVVGRVRLVDRSTVVYVVAPTSGTTDPMIPPGRLELRVVGPRTQDAASVVVLSPGIPAPAEGLLVTFVRETRFTGLIVARDPGRALVFGGAALLVVGFAIASGLRERRAWASVATSAGSSVVRVIATRRRPGDGDMAWFEEIVDEIQAALHSGRPMNKERPRC